TPTGTALVSAACETCHLPPAHAGDTWARNLDGGTPAAYHASLGAQPSSCVDCHANTRPKAVLSLTRRMPVCRPAVRPATKPSAQPPTPGGPARPTRRHPLTTGRIRLAR